MVQRSLNENINFVLYCFRKIYQGHPVKYSRNPLFGRRLFALPNSLPTLYIPSLPMNCKQCFSERKPQQIHSRVRDCYTHNHLHISLWFSLNSYLSIFRFLRSCQPKHLPHLFSVSSEILVLLGSIGRSHLLVDAIGLNYGIQKVREDKTPRSPLVEGVWRDQVHGVDLVWRVFCYSCTPTLFFSGSISTWRVAERFFTKFFDFPFNNKSWCYLAFASFFPTL